MSKTIVKGLKQNLEFGDEGHFGNLIPIAFDRVMTFYGNPELSFCLVWDYDDKTGRTIKLCHDNPEDIDFESFGTTFEQELKKVGLSIDDVQNGKKMWVLYGYLPGLLFSIIPLFLTNSQSGQKNIYGLSGYWCWIGFKEGIPFDEMKAQNIFTLIFYIFTWLNLIFSIVAMISSIARFSTFAKKVEEQNEEGFQRIKFFCDFIFYFPFIRVVGWLIPTANRIYGLCTSGDNKLLYIAHGISMSLVGFFSSIVFFVYQFKSFVPKGSDQEEAKLTDNEVDVDLCPEDD